MKLSFSIAFLALIPFATAAMFSEPCIPDGDTHDVDFSTSLTGNGTPTSAEVVPGSGKAKESDPFSPDDNLGPASDSTSGGVTTFTVPIENKAGSLSGPNGTSQNGGSEGDCIEVYVKFKIRYRVTVSNSTTTTVEPGGIGGSTTESESYEVWRYKWMWIAPTKTICPC